MRTFLKRHRRGLFVGLFIILILATVAFSLRGAYRSALLPDFTQRYRIHALENTYAQEYANLGQPFQALGMSYKAGTPACDLDWAHGYSTSVGCSVFAQVGTSSLNKNPAQKFGAAAALNRKLTSNGWVKETGGGSIVNSATALLQNPPYYYAPFNTYYGNTFRADKEIGNISCLFSLDTDSTGQTLSGEYSCSETFKYFGNPY